MDGHRRMQGRRKQNILFVNKLELVNLSGILRRYGSSRLGFIHMEAMTLLIKKFLQKEAPGIEFADITDAIDPVKARKSPEELALIKNTVKLQETVFNVLPFVIRPDRTIMEIDREMRYFCECLGSKDAECLSLCLQAGNPNEGAVPYRSRDLQPGRDRRLAKRRPDVSFAGNQWNRWIFFGVGQTFLFGRAGGGRIPLLGSRD